VDKTDIRKSIISQNRHKEIDHLTDRTGHESCPKSLGSNGSRIVPQISVPNLTDRTGHESCSKSHGSNGLRLYLTKLRHDLLTTLHANERTSCSEWRCSIRPESQGESLGQCFICNWLCIGLTDSVLSSGPIVLTVPQICNNWAAAALSAQILGMNPTWAELSVCARAQVAVRYELKGRGRYRLLSHSMVLLNAQPAADSPPRECFNLKLATQKQEVNHHTRNVR